MLFNSIEFAVFFTIVIGLYFSIPHRFRWVMLLVASYYFYMCWKVEYVLLIFTATLVDYFVGLRMSNIPNKKNRRKYLLLSLTCNLGILFFFKYWNFLGRSVNAAFGAWNVFSDIPLFDVLLPVGISFYTFQTLSYTVDVYKGRIPAERHLGYYALYVSFWPQLVAGPIERPHHLIPQLKRRIFFDHNRIVEGLRLMLWGLFKKVAIADHLAVYVNRVYNHVDDYQGAPLLIATAFFAVQIYCDFSGYTDMARGAARVMGVNLMENFNRPYFAKSIREFWQRWHISLSTWFRDYVYIPLGGKRVVRWRWHYNLMVTFLLSGLWHGANWTFVLWGALHGCYLVMENVTGNFQKRLVGRWFPGEQTLINRAGRAGITLAMVCFAWIFFRANTVTDAFTIIGNMFRLDPQNMGIGVVGMPSFLRSIALLLILFFVEMAERRSKIHERMVRLPMVARWSVYTAAVWAIALSGIFGVRQEFIYFQF